MDYNDNAKGNIWEVIARDEHIIIKSIDMYCKHGGEI